MKKGTYIDLTGQKFGRLTAIEYAGRFGRRTKWRCKCECGNETLVDVSKLRSGHTKSCGCYKNEKIKKLNYKTGMSSSRLYLTHRNMLNRCYREDDDMYRIYGERGITVCDEWRGDHGFENFLAWSMENGYKEGLSIDRIDNNRGYSPDNCRWVDKYVQANNKRNNHYLKINGEIDTVANHARKHNVSYWNLLHYAKGGKNCMYPDLDIEVVKRDN